MGYRFQVDLRGILDLLSNHLYSSPQVFIRELLQNSVDAISQRQQIDPELRGRIEWQVLESEDPPRIRIRDNGVGLTEQEIHEFVATLGRSGKTDSIEARRDEFLGQFGIGLLSCFLVSETIRVRSRSAHGGAPVVWLGRHDGTYDIKAEDGLDDNTEPGTEIELICRSGFERFFRREEVQRLNQHFGELLPIDNVILPDTRFNGCRRPWHHSDKKAQLQFGKRLFGTDFLDCIPIHSEELGFEGVAFVLPQAQSPAARTAHRVYLRGMLVAESLENLLPPWAFFVRCVINTQRLRPTASREAFYEDTELEKIRGGLGETLRDWLLALADKDPDRLRRLLRVHVHSLKALASSDDTAFRIFAKWLPFETTDGMMTLGAYCEKHKSIRFTSSLDSFRQIAPIATTQKLCVINAAYAFELELLMKTQKILGLDIEQTTSATLLVHFDQLETDEEEFASGFMEQAQHVLLAHGCEVLIRKFLPKSLPTFYSATRDSERSRKLDHTKEISGMLWSSVLGKLSSTSHHERPTLCFNYNNPIVRRLLSLDDEGLLSLLIPTIYVQALLLGHHPLSTLEVDLLNRNVLDLVDWSLESRNRWLQ
ncbi:MAG: HSP90 family protein [Myxococcota bacterium]